MPPPQKLPDDATMPPRLPDDVIEEILPRLPPDDPSCLLRASLVCKSWCRFVSGPIFLRRLHALHGPPPVLGVLCNGRVDENTPTFLPATASPFSLADAPDPDLWLARDFRHGRALFLSPNGRELLVWESITGRQQRVPLPDACLSFLPGAAVVCAADGCDHLGCHGGPFRVVLVFAWPDVFLPGISALKKACVYSSETGAWGEPTSVSGAYMNFDKCAAVLAGKNNPRLYFMDCSGMRERILEYDLAGGGLAVIEPPEEHPTTTVPDRLMLMVAEGGGLGVAETLEFSVCLRKWEPSAAKWVQSRVIDLRGSLPIGDDLLEWEANAMAFAEGANAIVVGTDTDIFTVDLRSGRVRRVLEEQHRHFNRYTQFGPVIPVVGFYTPRPRLQQAPSSLWTT